MTVIEELIDAYTSRFEEDDPSFLIKLLYFFPIDKVYTPGGSYDQYLYDLEKTVIDNFNNGNFQVAFFNAHLVFMSFVYYCVEKTINKEPSRVQDIYYSMNAYSGKNNKPDLTKYNSVYEFSKIPEKDIFKIFHALKIDDGRIRDLSRYISSRDDYAHATGKGNISIEELKANIEGIINFMEMLSECFFEDTKKQYIDFLMKQADYGYAAICENVYYYPFENNLSIWEIERLGNIGLRKCQDERGYSKNDYLKLRSAHCSFIEACFENYGIDLPPNLSDLRDENYMLYRYAHNANEYVQNELVTSNDTDFSVYDCPECKYKQLVYVAEYGKFLCFECGAKFTDEELCFCERCGNIMPKGKDDDWGSNICTDCIEDMHRE